VPRLEPADRRTLPGHPKDLHRRRQALDLPRAQVLDGEEIADQLPRAGGDDQPAGLGHTLQPGGEIGRAAGQAVGVALAAVDHDHARGDADPGRERPAVGRTDPGDRAQDLKPRPHRPLGRVLQGLRPAEADHHAVTGKAGRMPARRLHHLAYRPPIGLQQLVHVLGVHVGRECRGAHEIDEHDGELPPLDHRFGRGSAPGPGPAAIAVEPMQELDPAGHLELAVDGVEMRANGRRRDFQLARDLLVGQPIDIEPCDLALARAERGAVIQAGQFSSPGE
jgi:hypothetical protein